MVAGVEALKERIRQRAKEEAQAVIAEAEKQAAEIIAKAKARAEKERADILAAAEREADERKRRTLAMAAMRSRRQELKTKEELIDEAFSLAIQKLQQLPADKYQQLLKPILLAAVETGTEQVVIADHDTKRIDSSFINAINEELKAQGKVGALTLAKETRQLQGGFILSAGGVENNYSFELILKLSRDELEQEVASVLFPAS
ncbi:MAG: V-type ATP synthase subunit E [bacterium]|jgi:V/A-type H+-transporting ATPase subunit E